MAKYELTEAELYFKKQLEEKGYKFIEKDGEKPIIYAKVLSNHMKNILGIISQEKLNNKLELLNTHSVPFFLDSNGNIYSNWFPYY